MSAIEWADKYLIDHLREQGAQTPPLALVDVGCSGGVADVWRLWGDQLSGVGVDVLENEIERLRAAETNPNLCYEAARICAPPGASAADAPSSYALHRAACYLATIIMERNAKGEPVEDFAETWRALVDGKLAETPIEANGAGVENFAAHPFFGYYARRFGSGQEPRPAKNSETLDSVLARTGISRADMLKVDTDGADFDVLRGASALLKSLLAVEIEVQFHGPASDDANTFSNIDRLLTRAGFKLMKLHLANCAAAALPRPFLYDIPAQSAKGPLEWGVAVYARDLANPDYAKHFGFTPSIDNLRNLALIYDIFGLEDAAAELLLSHPDLFGAQTRGALDFLAAKMYRAPVTYDQVTAAFLADPMSLKKLAQP